MNYITVGKENSCNIDLYYEDMGEGQPVVLIHGWPLSSRSWERQVPALLKAGFRVIAYDRRGFGQSSRPGSGYDYDTLADDLHALMTRLDLRKAVLVGFSMGGGEVAHYLGRYGTERVQKAVFMAAVTPFLRKAADNAAGLDAGIFEEIKQAIRADRPSFLTSFLSNFYNVHAFGGKKVSEELLRLSWSIAAAASPIGTLACVDSWLTDFRDDLVRIRIPTLVMHGDDDRILPFAATGSRTHEAVEGSRLIVVAGAPHGLNWTHAEEVNDGLIDFMQEAI
ncbi:chloroperoxidase/bromoperoxidase, non-heme-type [Citrifermentans bemidjiense Bem]|uniref:Chloroperoxidase/bromoperoxidase, non-heme-type n=1 Tax=Citrifermentans bemidjiense (strain ATCC BAA-1014 / DSM 16622 / JCM 12645 / Bem) TaxID=404380 RepID=B5E8D4_CITBB|nr:alpha/beta hydrolase [Citrifermentans bemidjiense]ACH37117.1 chloroperoxidase/bromoperoxidase, non-heme-type [Citrifermentans bemidjiense Bem]